MRNSPEIIFHKVGDLVPRAGNPRTHSRQQIQQIASSIERFGFTNPLLIGDNKTVIAGHGRLAAAKLLKMTEVPTLHLSHLNEAELRAYVIADNKLALNAGWDHEILAIEFQALTDLEFDISLTGFSLAEADQIIDLVHNSNTEAETGPEDEILPRVAHPVTQTGDVWHLGHHRLICGDARNEEDYKALLLNETVDLIFTDPPYNVPIQGHVSGLGRNKHKEFAMGVGEMSEAAFIAFLTETLGVAVLTCRDGTIAYVCMDWRHTSELITAGKEVFTELKNICVWNKTNGGMGTFYRSKHEFVLVFKVGTGPHVNTFGLGDTGRYRTNVWDYPGVNSPGRNRMEELAMHPTVKPVALVKDAILDCSRRGNIVLDVFGGSGTTLIAAQMCGRIARLIEYDPGYCDTIIQRYERFTGKQASLAASGDTYEDVAYHRLTTDN